ncbi:Kh domain-containing protein [Mycena venus]|uniref:Kh domain-containing protein n=1 Tax=Mycena venus TaxID=2733690 RepID=A0A8H7D056_9AGAR|nr:Kh domain-containing protein [Mycena venus]
MSSKRKWDQAAPDAKETSNDEPAAKKQGAEHRRSRGSCPRCSNRLKNRGTIRNRYMLTKASTQQQIREEAGGSVSTKGVWYPDRSKATDKDPPVTIDTINEYIAIDMGSLVEDKKKEKRKWPEEKLPVGLESIRNFNIRAKVVGPSGSFVKYIQQETQTRVQIKGIGSGFVDQETGRESDEPLYIHITGPEEGQVARAKVLTEDLLLVVRSEHAKVALAAQQEQMELRQAQMQYAAYSAMASGGYAAPPPPSGAPPPPPGEQPPPPPDGSAAGPPAASDVDAYAAYWAAYGYDVNSAQFKEWAASQQQQYSQYYSAQAGQPGQPAPPAAPAPDSAAPSAPTTRIRGECLPFVTAARFICCTDDARASRPSTRLCCFLIVLIDLKLSGYTFLVVLDMRVK